MIKIYSLERKMMPIYFKKKVGVEKINKILISKSPRIQLGDFCEGLKDIQMWNMESMLQ